MSAPTLMPIPLDGDTARWLYDHRAEAETMRRFVALMLTELAANDGKGNRPGWLAMDRSEAISEVHWHASKLAVAAKCLESAGTDYVGEASVEEARDDVREFAADVANCALMALDCMGLLRRESP